MMILKKTIFCLVFLSSALFISAQVLTPHPIPKLIITSSNLNSLGNNISHLGAIETNGNVNIIANQNMEIVSSREIVFNPGTEISTTNNKEFDAYINANGLDVVWYTPNATPGTVGKYEKLEIGVKLPDNAEEQIDNFIAENTQTALNPFNPNDIDIKAEFWYYWQGQWSGPVTRYGFFYKDFVRNTTDIDPNNWSWTKQNNNYRFRVRFAPSEVGMWRCRITANINNVGVFTATDFTFNCVPSNNKGFVKVSDNNFRYLRLGNESFFPIGQNLPNLTCSYDTNTGDFYGCDSATYNEWHCGVVPANYYLAYLDELEKLKNAGANYFRVLDFPWSYQIEFEKLGNYYNRMNKAWELDKMIEKAEVLDLKMHFNLMYGVELMELGFYDLRCWDWSENTTWNTDMAFCYATELGLQNPIEFLTNPQAKEHYKNRLRYIVSRWGYSTSIAIIELMSEINQPYKVEQGFADERSEWHKEMADYLKNELLVNQLLSVSYTGRKDPKIADGDSSYYFPDVDIMTTNIHAPSLPRKGDLDYCVDFNRYYSFYNYNTLIYNTFKPFIMGEISVGEDFYTCDDKIKWKKDLWLSSFSGLAGTALNWNEQHNYALWHHFGKISDFIKDVDFDDFYPPPTMYERNDHCAEMSYLIDPTSGHKKAIGVIVNNTWNYFTCAVDTPCSILDSCSEVKNIPELQMLKSVSNGTGNNKLEIKGMGNGSKYKIEWYDALTNTHIFTDEKKSWWGSLTLDHPILTGSRQIIAFKIYRKKDGQFKSLQNKTDTVLSSITFPLDSNLNEFIYTPWQNKTRDSELLKETESISNKIDVFPNPTTGVCTIKFNGSIKNANFYLISYEGTVLIQEKWRGNQKEIDMTNYSPSIYFVLIKNEKESYSSRIIKL